MQEEDKIVVKELQYDLGVDYYGPNDIAVCGKHFNSHEEALAEIRRILDKITESAKSYGKSQE